MLTVFTACLETALRALNGKRSGMNGSEEYVIKPPFAPDIALVRNSAEEWQCIIIDPDRRSRMAGLKINTRQMEAKSNCLFYYML